MSQKPACRETAPAAPAETATADDGPMLDLDRYVPAFITFIANKLSNSATVFYQRNFGVNVTEWRIMSLLAIEPGIPASRICHVIGFDKGPVSRNLAVMQKRGLVAIRTAPDDGRTHAISLTAQGTRDPRQGDRRRARTRTPAVVLPEEGRAGGADRPAAAAARKSRRRDRPEQHLIARRRSGAGIALRAPAFAPRWAAPPSIRFLPHGMAVRLLFGRSVQ